MAQKGIREYDAKKLLSRELKARLGEDYSWDYAGLHVTKENFEEVINEWDYSGKIVVKPDQLFGKRGKNGLVFITDSKADAINWLKEKTSGAVRVKKNDKDAGIEGELEYFVVEPALPFDEEYYVSIKTDEADDIIYFSTQGGVDIEENWDSVVEIRVPFTIEEVDITKALKAKLDAQPAKIIEFINALYSVFKALNFTYLELNPFVISEGEVLPLDCVARLDSTAEYDMDKRWEIDGAIVDFPTPFGLTDSKAEKEVARLDFKTSASLKLTMLNQNGRLWALTPSGGASIIFSDTIADLGHFDELGNYGEFSGNPNTDETKAYCDVIINEMFGSNAENKILFICGQIANFSDVLNAFKGIVISIKENQEKFREQNIKIYVRRGGPRYKQGLKYIKEEIENLDIPIEVHGPELELTRIIKLALAD